MGYTIYDPLSETEKQMSEYATPNPGGDYNEYNVDPSVNPYPV